MYKSLCSKIVPKQMLKICTHWGTIDLMSKPSCKLTSFEYLLHQFQQENTESTNEIPAITIIVLRQSNVTH